MRLLLALATVASLAACSSQNGDGFGRASPETGRAPASDSMARPADTAAVPSTGARADTMQHADTLHQMHRDSQ